MTVKGQVLVVADDLTGANAVSGEFVRAGFSAATVVPEFPLPALDSFQQRFDVVSVSTNSRHVSARDAAARAGAVVRTGWPVRLVTKRIDSTLRGNIGVEVASVLRVVASFSGRRVLGLCVPAHPRAGRTTLDGRQLLKGTPLEQTELSRDARAPVRSSQVTAVLTRATAMSVAHVPLALVGAGRERLVAALLEAVSHGVECVVCDALTEQDIDWIAEAAADAAAEERLTCVGIDPGPGSVALARALGLRRSACRGPVLVVSASATELTRVQLKHLVSARRAISVRPRRLTHDRTVIDVESTAEAVAAAVDESGEGGVVLMASVIEAGDLGRLSHAECDSLLASLAKVARLVLERCAVGAVFATGGDLTAALLTELGATGLAVQREILPLAVGGLVADGPWAGLPIATKGGLVGNAGAVTTCIDYLITTEPFSEPISPVPGRVRERNSIPAN